MRTEAREESKWNLALCGMREDVARAHAEAQAEPTEESADSLQELVQDQALYEEQYRAYMLQRDSLD